MWSDIIFVSVKNLDLVGTRLSERLTALRYLIQSGLISTLWSYTTVYVLLLYHKVFAQFNLLSNLMESIHLCRGTLMYMYFGGHLGICVWKANWGLFVFISVLLRHTIPYQVYNVSGRPTESSSSHLNILWCLSVACDMCL